METIEFAPTNYPSDLTDMQWKQIAKFFPQGPNSDHHKRSLVNAVLYLIDNGLVAFTSQTLLGPLVRFAHWPDGHVYPASWLQVACLAA